MFRQSARFLIVDDSDVIREIVRSALNQLKYKNIHEAENGNEAWNMITSSLGEQRPYDLVFCDILMPELDGLELLDRIRNSATTKDLPVIILTTESKRDTVLRAVKAGISGYLVKPFVVEAVKAKLKDVYDRVQKGTP